MPTSLVKCPVCLDAYEIPFLIEKTLIFVRINELRTYRIASFLNESILFIHDKASRLNHKIGFMIYHIAFSTPNSGIFAKNTHNGCYKEKITYSQNSDNTDEQFQSPMQISDCVEEA